MALAKADFTTRLLLDAGIGPGMRVLDVGCGHGDVSLLLASLVDGDGAVVGIDQSDAALQVARQRELPKGAARPEFVHCDLHALPTSLGLFDAIVGRRVLMYQADAVKAVRALARHLLPGGLMVFQEHDTTLTPASLEPFPLHRKATRWLQRMLAEEGADLHMGFNLHGVMTGAGLQVEEVRAECLVQTPDNDTGLATIIRGCLPRIVALGVATARQVGIETLQARLEAEREQSRGIYIGDVAFACQARKP
ncbi:MULTISPECIES: class I SAM-dependent methyltransferase [unclassified Pseudomonas]|uniref:class I SAM-dependent methyltransferase n=1 Tax=unclassified Pseudomonas TaxID=196821 RepID=UPI0024490A50|nr:MULTISPECIES: class I SAM-dependent methyltransferase [unclassified Pseudomonas]MDH0301529.1 class I SAM-dependent methyltransferase [Pseudomonas sp. GD04091]MDH1985423.1 class I SAM-dependent methyltransferase [Pseudomonas sp. GD03689]